MTATATIPSLVRDPDRLRALAAYGILDTVPEPGFDDLVVLARNICSTPVALVSFVDHDRQWFKARIGFPPCETDLNRSVCAHVLAEPDILVIPDLVADPRTAANPLVTGEPHIRFYAGAPLRTTEGHVLGSLCVIDHTPRPDGLSPVQAESLRALARQVMTQMDLRRTVIEHEAHAATKQAILDAGDDLDTILAALVVGAMRAIPAAEGGVLELIDGPDLEYRAVGGTLSPHQGMRVPMSGSTSGACATTDTAILVADAHKDPRVRQDVARTIGQRSSIHVPVRREGRVAAVLKLQSGRPNAFEVRDLRLAELFAGIAIAGLAAADEAGVQRRIWESQERYRLAARATNDAIWDWDLTTNHILWNVALQAAYGHTLEVVEPTGDWWIEHIHPEDQAKIGASIHAVIDGTSTAWSDEYRFRRADGTYADVLDRGFVIRDVGGRATRMIGAMFDLTERKQAETALRASEQRLDLERSLLRAVFDQAPVGISLVGTTLDMPTIINAQAERILGHGVGEPGEKRYTRYGAIHADGTPYASEDYPTLRALRHGEVVRAEEMRYRNAQTGEVRRLEVSSGPVRAADGTIRAATTVFVDVEDRLRAEAAMNRLAAIVEQSSDFIGIADTQGRGEYINLAGRRLVGITDDAPADEIRVRDFFSAEDLPYVESQILPQVLAGETWAGDFNFQHFVTGEPVPVHYNQFSLRDPSGGFVGFATVSRDIAERKRAEAALRMSEASLRAVLDTVPVGILFAEAPSGRVIGGNDRVAEILGHPILLTRDAESYGEWVAFHSDGRRVEPGEYPLARIIREGLDHAELECAYERGDGTRAWIAISGAPMRDEMGTVTGAVVAVADIDARKQAEAQQDLVNHELSHRMKNLLAMVQSIASQTMRSATEVGEARDLLVGRLIALGKAHDLLLGGALASTRMESVIRAAVQVHQDRPERFKIIGPDIEINADQALALALSIHELSTNAAKYGALSAEAGWVAVTWEIIEDEARPLLRLSWLESGGPPVWPPTRKGFGSRFLERALVAQVGGEMALAYPESGVTFTLTAPLAAFTTTR